LARALRNIVDNAVAHARSRIRIAVTDEIAPGASGGARLVVDDDGPGIPAADRTRVFDRFVRLEADRSRTTGGSGLGLAIVAEIVAAHGGVVLVDESPWGGARFVVELPVTGPPDR
jgi:signal transduction histidine kinase